MNSFSLPIGTHVQLRSSHPHAYETGVIVAYEKLHLLPYLGECPRIKLDSCRHGGSECFATKITDLKVIRERRRRGAQ